MSFPFIADDFVDDLGFRVVNSGYSSIVCRSVICHFSPL